GIKKGNPSFKKKFSDYSQASSQMLSLNKCKFYTMNASARKITNVVSWLAWLKNLHPSICFDIEQIHIPCFHKHGRLIWKHSSEGALTKKDAYAFIKPSNNPLNWCKSIWSSYIPPSNSFLTWRLMLKRLPTDENLMRIGIPLASICSLCLVEEETFAHCKFAFTLWQWLSSLVVFNFNHSSVSNLLDSIVDSWSAQVNEVLVVGILNTIATIWFCRNNLRDQAICSSSAFSAGIFNPQSFSCFKKLQQSSFVKRVDFDPSCLGWVKINIDGAAKWSPDHAGGGGIFRDIK
ncbi:hypothetical protein Lal_00036742, partial [Lupinus albus]